MSAECPPELFKQFEESPGGWARLGEDGQQFLYNALGDHMDFADATCLTIPPLKNETFNDWQKFENWCDELHSDLMWKIVDEDDESFQEAHEKSTPDKYFKSKSAVRAKIIKLLCAADLAEPVTYVEIQCGNKKLFLIYFDSDSWSLDHGDSVLVIKSLDELNKKNGFYP